jgi:hypothetical protein
VDVAGFLRAQMNVIIPVSTVAAVEILAGLLMASYFATSGLKHRRRSHSATQ